MHITRKDARIKNTGTTDDMPGTFEVVLSAPTLDRDGDTLLPEDWEQPLPDHITFDQDHAMTVAGTVGSGTPTIDDEGRLIVTGTYSSLQRAQDVRTLVNEGHIKTTSVAFMSKKVAKAEGDGYKVVRELLNGAFVAIPSNREALVLNSKSGARNNSKDAETIQTMHDGTVALGASCATDDDEKQAHRATLKAIAGSLEALQESMRGALGAAYPGQWAWLRATLPGDDGAGTLIFELEDGDTFESTTYQQSYSTDENGTISLQGDPVAVVLEEVVSGAAAGAGQPNGTPAADAAGTEAAAADAAAADGKAATAAGPGDPTEEEQLLASRKTALAAINRITN